MPPKPSLLQAEAALSLKVPSLEGPPAPECPSGPLLGSVQFGNVLDWGAQTRGLSILSRCGLRSAESRGIITSLYLLSISWLCPRYYSAGCCRPSLLPAPGWLLRSSLSSRAPRTAELLPRQTVPSLDHCLGLWLARGRAWHVDVLNCTGPHSSTLPTVKLNFCS